MRPFGSLSRPLHLGVFACTWLVSGCAQLDFGATIAQTRQDTDILQTQALALNTTAQAQAEPTQRATALLQQPLTQADAVELALLHSPALQTLLAQSWADSARAAQSGRIHNPLLSIGRMRVGSELEIESALSFGLLDVLTLPRRQEAAQHALRQTQLRLSADVVDAVTQVRQAWVRAVAAQQGLQYARQVHASAQAGAELAQRMLAAGNFNKLNQARQQSFYAASVTQLALAEHARNATRESLVRVLGLSDAQAGQLQLPERLPDIPAQARDAGSVTQAVRTQRLDIRMAQAALDAATQRQGLQRVASYGDIELKAKQKSKQEDGGHNVQGNGWEIELRLPLLDAGDIQRQAIDANTLAALQQLESTVRAAGSHLRETYSAYFTAHAVARHYRDVIVPLRKEMSDENLLRYNGMLLGVFELLADARDQVMTVQEALQAEQQFWLADAALQSALLGQPMAVSLNPGSNPRPADAGGH